MDRTAEFWEAVLWTDETKLDIFGHMDQDNGMSGVRKARLMTIRIPSPRSSMEVGH